MLKFRLASLVFLKWPQPLPWAALRQQHTAHNYNTNKIWLTFSEWASWDTWVVKSVNSWMKALCSESAGRHGPCSVLGSLGHSWNRTHHIYDHGFFLQATKFCFFHWIQPCCAQRHELHKKVIVDRSAWHDTSRLKISPEVKFSSRHHPDLVRLWSKLGLLYEQIASSLTWGSVMWFRLKILYPNLLGPKVVDFRFFQISEYHH